MSSNYTPIDLQAFEQRYAHASKSTVLFIIIVILSIIVMGLLVFILMRARGT